MGIKLEFFFLALILRRIHIDQRQLRRNGIQRAEVSPEHFSSSGFALVQGGKQRRDKGLVGDDTGDITVKVGTAQPHGKHGPCRKQDRAGQMPQIEGIPRYLSQSQRLL